MNEVDNLMNVFNSHIYNTVNKICQPLNTYFQCEALGYLRITPEGKLFTVSNTPDETLEFWNNSLYRDNPFYTHPDNYEAAIYPLNEIKNVNYQSSLRFLESRTKLYLHMRIVKKIAGVTHQLIFGTRDENHPFNTLFINNKKKFISFVDYFIENIDDLITDQYCISMPKILNEKFLLPNKTLTLQLPDFPNNKYYKISNKLTLREKECCLCLLSGMSARLTANHLFLSPRTVENYLNTIKMKLNVVSKSEMIILLNKLKDYDLL